MIQNKLVFSLFIAIHLFGTSVFAESACGKAFGAHQVRSTEPSVLTLEQARRLPRDIPRSFIDPAGPETRNINEIKTLKIFEFNVENLFLRNPSILKANQQENKPVNELKGIALIISKADPDIAVLPEVDNYEALSEFNKRFLNGKYRPLLLEGNDSRGIDVGVLVKSDLPFDVEMRSFTYVKENDGDPVFSRDLPTWIFREKGRPSKSLPLFVVAGTHYKSLIGSKKDPNGTNKRLIQAETSVEILKKIDAEFGGDTPIIITGDFNNDVHKSPEFRSLHEAGFKDSVALMGRPWQPTHAYFESDGTPAGKPIDSIMLNPSFQNMKVLLDAMVLSHLDADGNPLPFPKSFKERENRPSDHVPSMAVFDFSRLWAIFLKK